MARIAGFSLLAAGLATGLLFAGLWLHAAAQVETHVDGIVACYPEDNAEFWQVDATANEISRQARASRLAGQLQASANPEHQALGLVLFEPEASRLTALQVFALEHPDSKVAALHRLSACLGNSEAPACGDAVVSAAINVAADNAVTWYLIAQYRALQQNQFGADAALRAAAAAPGFDDYFSAQFDILRQYAPESGSDNDDWRWFPYDSLAYWPTMNLLGKYLGGGVCARMAPDSLTTAQNCLSFFQRLRQEGGSTIYRRLAESMQLQLLQQSGDFAARARLEGELAAAGSARRTAQRGSGDASQLMFFDADLSRQWLASLAQDGEEGATRRLVDQALSK